ncbi:MAG: hypothetical protein IKL55_07025 [Clostridia bacterium]|nr:hypothetical protein [Clostridia bacterium]
MKNVIKKMLKIFLIAVISSLVIYIILTAKNFLKVSEKYQLFPIFLKRDGSFNQEMIQELGDEISLFANMIEEDAIYKDDGQNHFIGDGHEHTIGDFYDPIGYSAWNLLQAGVYNLFTNYISISIALGIVIAIAYGVITSKRINKVLKFVIGYAGVILAFPPLYMYSWTFRFWDLKTMYVNGNSKFFYMIYTIIFILICLINYIISKKMTKDLNNAIEGKKN